MTREAFENAIVVNAAIDGSTNAPIYLNSVAQHMGVQVSIDGWDLIGSQIPLLLNMQPSGQYLGEEYYRAGGLPAIMAELLDAGKLHGDTLACNGRTLMDNVRGRHSWDRRVIRPCDDPLMKDAGFIHLKGNLFDSAIMKTCVISPAFRQRYLSDLKDPGAFEGNAVVFDGPEDFHRRVEGVSHIDERSALIMRSVGPLGYPGAAEAVNMDPPGRLIKEGIDALFCVGDGQQSGTSASPSILKC
ncbi:uncharacterized protein ACHE_50424A [Aspergillus chevalieri]|uniref:Uncharacterized protein n=1 Tax=Aspergillus chevalieri TaxID=182096 RepID=A0A7R7ZPZ1_ASPCH|nr:uncharacterized protein ACHE_50424A [Aspergillus chevalieri]BCR89226.1 hypothetical protein ACHE_50424A [Aspergillus chevalieri]